MNPRFGFTLDPVAEYLAAKRSVIAARGDPAAWARLMSLVEELEDPSGDSQGAGFAAALRECAAMEDRPTDP